MQERASRTQQEVAKAGKPYNGDNGVQGSEGAVGGQLEGGVADIPCQGLQHRSLCLQLEGAVAAWLDESVDGPAHLQSAPTVMVEHGRKLCMTDALCVAVSNQMPSALVGKAS